VLSDIRVLILVSGLSLITIAQGFMDGSMSSSEILFALLTNAVLAVYLFWLQSQAGLRRRDLWLLLWLNLWIVGNVNNMIEGYYFTDLVTLNQLISGAAFTLLLEALRSGLTVYLTPPGDMSLLDIAVKHIRKRSLPGWLIRLGSGALGYFPIYFFFGMLISPFIMEYYSNAGMGLKIPPFITIIPLEILRGTLYILCLFPLLISVRGDLKQNTLALTGMLFIPGALIPLLTNQALPQQILPYHTVEILADSITYGLLLSWTLK
jgi:hypothetical protein